MFPASVLPSSYAEVGSDEDSSLDPRQLISEVISQAQSQQRVPVGGGGVAIDPSSSSSSSDLPSPWGSAPFSPSAGSGPSALLRVGEGLRSSTSQVPSYLTSLQPLLQDPAGSDAGLPLLVEAAIGRSGEGRGKQRKTRRRSRDSKEVEEAPTRRRRKSKPSPPPPPFPLPPPPLTAHSPPPPLHPYLAPVHLHSSPPSHIPEVTPARPVLPAGTVFRPTAAVAALVPTSSSLLLASTPASTPTLVPPFHSPTPPPSSSIPLTSTPPTSRGSAVPVGPKARQGSDKHDLLGKSYNKFNELVFCRHICGCRPSKYKCDKEGRPEALVLKLKEEHRARMVRATKRLHPGMTEEEVEREVGSLTWLDKAEILRRASRTMHEQNAALHSCGDDKGGGEGAEGYPCRSLLKAHHVNGGPVGMGNAATLGPSGGWMLKREEGSVGGDRLLTALYQHVSKWNAGSVPPVVEGEAVQLVPHSTLQHFHARGLSVPLLEVSLCQIADIPSFVWNADSFIRFGQLQVGSLRCSSIVSEGGRGERYPPLGADQSHCVLPISSSCVATCVTAGSRCAAEMDSPALVTATLPNFLYALTMSSYSTCYTQWSPPPPTGLTVSSDVSHLVVAATEGKQNLFRLLSSLSPAVSAIRPRCTRLAATGFRPLSAAPLFCSSAHVVLEGRLAWLSIPKQHWGKVELVAQALARGAGQMEERVKREHPTEPSPLLPYLNQTFIDPVHLITNGVPVYLTDQLTSSTVMCASGQHLLSAVVLSGMSCTVLDVPFLPVEWLLWGPQRCLKWVERLSSGLTDSTSQSSEVRAAVGGAVRHLFPAQLAPSLFPALVSDIRLHLSSTTSNSGGGDGAGRRSVVDFSSLSPSSLTEAIQALEQTTAALVALAKRMDADDGAPLLAGGMAGNGGGGGVVGGSASSALQRR